jgi:hypothetical protein
MTKFVIRVVEEIKAREVVMQLCIYGIGQLDLFEKKLVGTTYNGEYKSLISFIQHFANGGEPGKKVKYLKGNEGPTEFEFISKHLRIFAIQRPGRKLIIYAGLKKGSDSRDNIAVFRSIKNEYLSSLNQKK